MRHLSKFFIGLILGVVLAFGCDYIKGKVEDKLGRVEQCLKDLADMGDLLKDWVCEGENCFKMMKKKKAE